MMIERSVDQIGTLLENGHANLALDQLRALNSGAPEIRVLLGSCLEDLGRYNEAADEYAWAWQAGIVAVGDQMCSLLLSMGQPERLQLLLGEAEEKGVIIPTLRLQGTLAEDIGEIVDAEALYRRAADGGDPLVYSSLGSMLCEQGRLSEGIRALRRGVELGDWRAIENAALFDTEIRPESAVEQLFGLVEDGREHALLALAKRLDSLGATDSAEAAYLDALRCDILGTEDALLNFYVSNGRNSDAKDLFSARESVLTTAEHAKWTIFAD